MTEKSIAQGPDPRLNAYRPDLASDKLRSIVDAKKFVAGRKCQTRHSLVAMRGKPDAQSTIINEILFGEIVWVFEDRDGWAWCQLDRDGYVGYVPSGALSSDVLEPTHRVSAWGTFIYRKADIKSEPLVRLSLNSMLAIKDTDGKMSELASGGFVVNRHIADKSKYARDFVDLCERMIGSPYLWGGRSRFGIDCSGLVQVTMEAAGMACPRDSDMQCATVGEVVPVSKDLSDLVRGDLVFWPGHVGIMEDAVMLVHANAHHMAVAVEPLVTAVERIRKSGGEILKVRRVASLIS